MDESTARRHVLAAEYNATKRSSLIALAFAGACTLIFWAFKQRCDIIEDTMISEANSLDDKHPTDKGSASGILCE